MDCPQCGGPTFDNTQRVNGGWKGPMFKCRDKDGCGWVKWPPKGQQAKNNGASQSAPSRGPARPLGPLYHECMKVAKRILEAQFPKGGAQATIDHVLNATATLFIAASRDGAPLMPVKPKAAPPPPPPEPEPDAGPDYDDALPF